MDTGWWQSIQSMNDKTLNDCGALELQTSREDDKSTIHQTEHVSRTNQIQRSPILNLTKFGDLPARDVQRPREPLA
jgi:hypothetical protein